MKSEVPEVKLNELYQEVILDHNRNPRNFGKLEEPKAVVAHGVNPLCGDHFDVYLIKEGAALKKITFEGDGCAISKASASLMTQAVQGKSAKEASALKDHFIGLLTDPSPDGKHREGVGKLKFFEGVRNFPIRVKCATLAWRALEEAMKGNEKEVSTE